MSRGNFKKSEKNFARVANKKPAARKEEETCGGQDKISVEN
jgi:hypothetical protein